MRSGTDDLDAHGRGGTHCIPVGGRQSLLKPDQQGAYNLGLYGRNFVLPPATEEMEANVAERDALMGRSSG